MDPAKQAKEKDLVTASVVRMNRLASELLLRRPPPIREVPEQQEDCFTALDYLLKDAPDGLALRQYQLPVSAALSDDFPGLGPVDLTIESGERPVGLIELKLGKDKLWNSVWDLCKLALALRRGVGERAFMVGGAPDSSWQRERQGPGLFKDANYVTEDLLTDYANCFRLWKTAPIRLPSEIRVELVDTVSFVSGEVPYEMRVVEVFDEGSDWLDIHDGLKLRPA